MPPFSQAWVSVYALSIYIEVFLKHIETQLLWMNIFPVNFSSILGSSCSMLNGSVPAVFSGTSSSSALGGAQLIELAHVTCPQTLPSQSQAGLPLAHRPSCSHGPRSHSPPQPGSLPRMPFLPQPTCPWDILINMS